MSRVESRADGSSPGQTWLPRKGAGSVSLAYQHLDVDQHLFSGDVTGRTFVGGYVGQGRRVYWGDIIGQSMSLDVEYALHDRFTVNGNVLLVASRYNGSGGHPPLPGHSMVDDGLYHPAFQDAVLGFRYQALRHPLAVIPHVRVALPTHHYENVGHAAVGRGLKHLQIGTTLARSLDPVLRRAYLKGTIAYSFVERAQPDEAHVDTAAEVADLNIDRWNLALEAGYFLTSRLAFTAFASHIHTRDGIDWREDLRTPADFARIGHVHDAAAADRHSVVGVGAGVGVHPRTWLYASFARTVAGENTHDGDAFMAGVSWSFRGRRPGPP